MRHWWGSLPEPGYERACGLASDGCYGCYRCFGFCWTAFLLDPLNLFQQRFRGIPSEHAAVRMPFSNAVRRDNHSYGTGHHGLGPRPDEHIPFAMLWFLDDTSRRVRPINTLRTPKNLNAASRTRHNRDTCGNNSKGNLGDLVYCSGDTTRPDISG